MDAAKRAVGGSALSITITQMSQKLCISVSVLHRRWSTPLRLPSSMPQKLCIGVGVDYHYLCRNSLF